MTYLGEVERAAAIDVARLEQEVSQEIRHNWLYSVVPAFPLSEQHFAGGIYLTGYCKSCRSTFTVRLRDDGAIGEVVIQEHLQIPVNGCKPVV